MNYAFFTGASCGLLLLMAARIGFGQARRGGNWLLILIAGAFCYLVQPLLNIQQPLLHFVIELPVIFAPAAFWLFAHQMCSENQVFPRWGWGLIALDLLLEFAHQLHLHPTFYLLAQPSKLALIGAGIFTLLQQLHSDLVAERRQLRIALLITIGSYMVIVVCGEFLFSFYRVPEGIATLHVFLIAALTLAACLWLLALSPKALEASLPQVIDAPVQPPVEEKVPEPLDESQRALLEQLQQHMQRGGYRHTGLTIRELAEQLNDREYVLRALINKHLGFRNFNEYLNQYRIDEASRRLADPDEAHLPVLSIALDIGYRSLSPFNAAFKRRHDKTPTEFRREQLPA